MSVEIGEVTGDVTAIDLAALKAEIIADVMRRIEDERRLRDRLDADRRLRSGALDRPEDLV